MERKLGRNDAAQTAYAEALRLYVRENNRFGQANVQCGLGRLEARLGHNDAAREAFGEALKLHKQEENTLGQAAVERALGDLESKLGRNDAARAAYDAALTLYKRRRLSDRAGDRALGSRRVGVQAGAKRRGSSSL
jgi:tetratricopeptide (TPR) repeat protein